MNSELRTKIHENIEYLSRHTENLSQILVLLKKNGTLNSRQVKIIEEIPGEQDKIQNFYCTISKRGPSAFTSLLWSLKETNNSDVVQFFESKLVFKDRSSVVQADKRYDKDTAKHYKMGSKPKGYALIINIKKFVNNIHEEREGSEHDTKNLDELWKGLGFKTIIKNDVDHKEFKKILKEFRQMPEHKKVDSCVVFIMSHGISDREKRGVSMYTFDGELVHSERDIVNLFSVDNCPNLAGKPKMFFFQACRGTNVEKGVIVTDSVCNKKPDEEYLNGHGEQTNDNSGTGNQSNTDTTLMEENHIINSRTLSNDRGNWHPSSTTDCINVYSTHPGFVSLRDPTSGSWFIQDLCVVFANFSYKEPLLQMLGRVMDMVGNRYDVHHGTALVNYVNFTFKKTLYFNPGIYY